MINVLQNFHWKTGNNLIPLIWNDLILFMLLSIFVCIGKSVYLLLKLNSLKNLFWNLVVQFIGHYWAAAVFYVTKYIKFSVGVYSPFCNHILFDRNCQILSSLIMKHLKHANLETPNLIIWICWTLSTCDFHVTFCTNLTSFRFISIFQELGFSDVWMYFQEMEVLVGQEDLKGSKRTV